MGRPGSGKSTYLAIQALKALKQGKNVYSNVYIKGTKKLDVKNDLNFYKIEDGLVLIDEAGFEFNSRDWAKFGNNLYRFFTMHRHYNIDIILAVQMWDRVDLCIREVTQEVIIMRPTVFKRWMVKAVSVNCEIGVIDRKIQEMFDYVPLLAGGVKYMYRKKAMRMFDSFYQDDLEQKEWEIW